MSLDQIIDFSSDYGELTDRGRNVIVKKDNHSYLCNNREEKFIDKDAVCRRKERETETERR